MATVVAVFTKRCPGCLKNRGSLCPGCCRRLDPTAAGGPGGSCYFALGQPTGSAGDSVAGVALSTYEEFSERVIVAAKNGRTDVLADLGRLLARHRFALRGPVGGETVVSWIPASRSGRRSRGYDQGQLLARSVAAELNRLQRSSGRHGAVGKGPRERIAVCRLFTRHDRCRQTGRTRAERLNGPNLQWRGANGVERLLLVDDVVTTGSSMRSAVGLAEGGGVPSIEALALASVR